MVKFKQNMFLNILYIYLKIVTNFVLNLTDSIYSKYSTDNVGVGYSKYLD